MLERIAVALRSGRVEKAGTVSGRDFEGVFRAHGAHPQGFDSQAEILRRAGRRGEVEDVVHRAGIEGLADVPLLEAEARLTGQVGQVFRAAGGEVVDAENGVALA